MTMSASEDGRKLLSTLRLDGFTPGDMSLFAGIAEKYREVWCKHDARSLQALGIGPCS